MPISAGVTAIFMFSLGGVIGSLIEGRMMNAWGAYSVLLTEFVLSTLLIASLAYLGAAFSLMMAVTLILGIVVQGAQGGLNALAATYYPTAVRSTGVGWALGVGRVGSIAGPLLAVAVCISHWVRENTTIFHPAAEARQP